MVAQEQPVAENDEVKTTFSLIMMLRSLFIKLLIIAAAGGGAYWLYLHPDVWRRSSGTENEVLNEAMAVQISQLQNQVAALQSQLLTLPEPDVSEFADKVASLEKQNLNVIDSKADAAIVLGMLTRVDKLESRVDRLAKISDDGALILSAAMLVKQAAAEGSDFIYEAEILNQLTNDAAPIKKDVSVIGEYSRNGVVSEHELIRSFNDIYASSEEEKVEPQGWKERLNSKLNEYIKINKAGETAPKLEGRKKLDEIAALVNDGKIAKAVKLTESSDSRDIKQNQKLQEWLADAKNTVTFYQAIRNIAAYSLAEMKVNNLRNKE